jgi:hypothetical protein
VGCFLDARTSHTATTLPISAKRAARDFFNVKEKNLFVTIRHASEKQRFVLNAPLVT